MADFFDSVIELGTNIIDSVGDTINIMREPSFEQYNAAQRVFSTGGGDGFSSYNLPKLKFSFIVEFVLSETALNFIATQLPDSHINFALRNVSCFARSSDLPSTAFTLDKLNQYNKTRYQTGALEYKPVQMSFYDTSDSAALLLLDAYRKYYYGDFFQKDLNSFRNDVLSTPLQFESISQNWGRSVMNNGNYNEQYFFKRINIYEIDNDTYTCHNMFNVYIEDVQMEQKSMDSMGEPSSLTLTLKYEGMGNINNLGYPSIGVPSSEIAPLITDTNGLGKSGFFKYFGELDDKALGLLTVGKVIRAGAAGYGIIKSIGDIINGDISPDVIRNLGGAISKGAEAIGFDNVLSDANNAFGLGNILGDF